MKYEVLQRDSQDFLKNLKNEIRAEKEKAENYISLIENEKLYDKKVVTKVSSATIFYPAEDYHQNYYNENRDQNRYCAAVINPKLRKFKELYKENLK